MAAVTRVGAMAALLCVLLAACRHSGGEAGSAPAPAPHAARAPDVASLALPAPGTYVLDDIMRTPSATVLDSDGTQQPFQRFMTGKVTLFSFIYTACSDARGCPLALATMHALKSAIAQDPQLAEQVRFVSMSFDPAYDTPPLMRSYGGADAKPMARPRWYFLTTASPRELAPLLRGFGQDIRAGERDTAAAGTAAARPPLEHLLKIYLVDGDGVVREIYSPAFLQASTMLADIRSLARDK